MCKVQRNNSETKIVGISCSKYSRDVFEITVIDSIGDEKFDLTYRIKVDGDINVFFEEFARLYSRQFTLWKKASYMKTSQSAIIKSNIVKNEINREQ